MRSPARSRTPGFRPAALGRLARSPAAHFLLIGGCLFAIGAWPRASSGGHEARTIVIPADELRREWQERTGRWPDENQERALVERVADEEILFREALARGLDRRDDVVRRRLAELGGFLADDRDLDEPARVEEARRLGLDRSDPIVRRRLIELMRLETRRADAPEPVTDAELREAIGRDPGRYRLPPRISLTHVYLSRSRRADAAADARRLLDELRAARTPPDRAPALGDPFPLGLHRIRASERDLERRLGQGFAAALAPLGTGEWTGPVSSSYGEHLVWIHERLPGEMPSLEAVRTQVLERLREERAEERFERALRRLRAQYAIRIVQPVEPGSG